MNQKGPLRTITLICGILVAILSAFIPISMTFLPGTLLATLLKIDIAMIALTFALLVVSLIVSKNMFYKLTAIIITYVLVMITLMMKHSGAHLFFLNGLAGKPIPEINTGAITKYSWMLHGGVFVTAIPLVIYSIYYTSKLSKGKKNIAANGIPQIGFISNVEATGTKINKVRIYKVSIRVGQEEYSQYEVTRDMAVPNHIIHTISIGKTVNLLVNPNNKNEVFVNTEYGVL